MRLHENKELFRQAVAVTARHFKIDPSIVEKDYYVTIYLEELTKRLPNLLFKGGTSLSKCYKAINRFSEDIDLTLEQDVITQGQRKKVKQIIKETCDELNLKLLNESETRSRRDFNRYEIDYAPDEYCKHIGLTRNLVHPNGWQNNQQALETTTKR